MLYLCARWNTPSAQWGASPCFQSFYNMAKSSSFFGLRRGSTKSLTFSVMDGRQITKDRVTEVKNPRTVMQMNQRCLIKTISLAYSTMKSIVDHSFEGYTYGAQSMRRFNSVNFPLVKASSYASNPVFGFAAYKDSTPNMGQFKISEGSLSAPLESAVSVSFQDNKMVVGMGSGNSLVSQLISDLGVALGDIVTICVLVQDKDSNARFVWVRFIMPGADAPLSEVRIESNAPVSVTTSNGISASLLFATDAGINADTAALYGIIRSQKDTSGYKRSTAFLRSSVGSPIYRDSFADAIATYPKGAEYILNGDDVSVIGGGEVDPNAPHTLTLKASDFVTSHSFDPASPVSAGTQVKLTAVTSMLQNPYVQFPDGTSKNMTGSGDNWSLTFEMPPYNTQLEIKGEVGV